MDYNGVKFYSRTDLSVGHYLKQAEEILEQLDTVSKVNDINQVIELYNIECFLEEEIYLDNWSEQQR